MESDRKKEVRGRMRGIGNGRASAKRKYQPIIELTRNEPNKENGRTEAEGPECNRIISEEEDAQGAKEDNEQRNRVAYHRK